MIIILLFYITMWTTCTRDRNRTIYVDFINMVGFSQTDKTKWIQLDNGIAFFSKTI